MVGIKDFDMPSCCSDCGLWHYDRDDEPICNISYETIFDFKRRKNDCPLIEIKTEKDEDKMDNIELVIKIPVKDYDTLINYNDDRLPAITARINLYEAIKNGTPLSQGHGRLIDADALEIRNITVLYGYDWERGENTYTDVEVVRADDVWNAPTIIEADKGEEE